MVCICFCYCNLGSLTLSQLEGCPGVYRGMIYRYLVACKKSNTHPYFVVDSIDERSDADPKTGLMIRLTTEVDILWEDLYENEVVPLQRAWVVFLQERDWINPVLARRARDSRHTSRVVANNFWAAYKIQRWWKQQVIPGLDRLSGSLLSPGSLLLPGSPGSPGSPG